MFDLQCFLFETDLIANAPSAAWLVAVTLTEHVKIGCAASPPGGSTTFFSFLKALFLYKDLINSGM